MQENKKSLLLVSMPFAETSIPSIQLALLESYLKESNIDVSTRHLYLKAADFYGLHNYNFLINDPNDSYTAQMIFSKYVFPDHWNKNKEKIRYYYENIISYSKDISKNFSFEDYNRQTDEFIHWIKQNVDWKKFDIIGFTLNYGQILPSLAVAKIIKETYPEKHIIFGGSSVINDLGKRLLSLFNYLDFIVSGEGEKALFLLATDFENYQNIPGLIFREKNTIIRNEHSDYVDLDTLPYPCFESYFSELGRASNEIVQYYQLYGRMPIELSRGCWWNNCTFCNVGAYHKKFRNKNYDRFIDELVFLANTYHMLDFQVIGSTLPKNDYKTLCNKLVTLNRDFTLITESRAGSLNSSDYSLLREAGFTHIQTGIEAFSSNYLKKMNKGTRVIDNIAALKYCKENHIKNSYNLIVNYPNEEKIDFEETEKTIQLIQKYIGPPSISKFVLGYQSPIFNKLDRFNIKEIEPKIIDTIMYPEEILEKNFCFFYSFKRKNEIDENPWKELVSNWRKIYKNQEIIAVERETPLDKLVFYYKDGNNFLKIYDKRFDDSAMIYTLDNKERDLFLACTDVITLLELKEQFQETDPGEIEEILKSFVDAKIVYEEENCYLSLPINYQHYYNNKSKRASTENIDQIRAYVANL